MKKLSWRLSKLPTPDEVRELVKDKIITQDEAREILFSVETEEDRDKKSLEEEIKFLREIVEKLSAKKDRIIEVIREVQKPYYDYRWYGPYKYWCGDTLNSYTTYTAGSAGTALCSAQNSLGGGGIGNNTVNAFYSSSDGSGGTSMNFTDIQTF